MITIFSVLPALIYIIIIYLSTPYNTVKLANGSKFIFAGMLSGLLVWFSSVIFPNFYNDLFLNQHFPVVTKDGVFFQKTILTEFVKAFGQIATIEELCKFGCFYLFYRYFSKNDDNNSIWIMFSCILVAAGFAMLENMLYAYRYYRSFGDVLLNRSFTAVVLHMTCGAIVGYFMALGKKHSIYKDGRSEFWVWLRKNKSYKYPIYTAFGIILAILLHGLYDFDLSISGGYHTIITVGSLVLGFLLFRDLKKKVYLDQ